MISAPQPIAQHNNFILYLRNPGFEPLSNTLGKVASFIVQDAAAGTTAVFAFAYSLLDAMEDNTISEPDLLNKAIETIKSTIDAGQVTNRGEYPFRYQGNRFIADPTATWWVRSS